jgi:hypothetical protein
MWLQSDGQKNLTRRVFFNTLDFVLAAHNYADIHIFTQTVYGHAFSFGKAFPYRAGPRATVHKTFRFTKLRTAGT